jgi:hypothetical protein
LTFNVLSTVQGLILENDQEAAIEMISCDSRILRKMLINGRLEITLKEELEVIRDYLEIERIRQDDGFSYAIDVDPAIFSLLVPKSLLVGFVENAIKHGTRRLDKNAWVNITGRQEEAGGHRSGVTTVLSISNLAPAPLDGCDQISGSVHGSDLAYGLAELFFEKTGRKVSWETITTSIGSNLIKVEVLIHLT